MIAVEVAVRTRIAALPAVAAIAGSRIYVLTLPQQPTYPAVRVSLISEPGRDHLRGAGGTHWARVQVDAFTKKEASGVDAYGVALELTAAIEGDGRGEDATGLNGWRGSIGSPSLLVLGVFRDDRTPDFTAEELQLVRMRMDYIVWFRP